MGITERRERETRGGPAEDPGRRPRPLRDRRLRARHHAQDRRGHRVLAHRDLPPLRGQGRPGPGALPRGLRAAARSPARARRLPTDPVDWIRQLGRAYAGSRLDYPNHYRFMFMTPAKLEHEPRADRSRRSSRSASCARRSRRPSRAGAFRPGDVDTDRPGAVGEHPRRGRAARSRCGPTAGPRPAGRRPRRAGRSTAGIRGFLRHRREQD